MTEKLKINTNIQNRLKYQASEGQGGTSDHLYKAVLPQKLSTNTPPSDIIFVFDFFLDPCTSNPCQNNGTCFRSQSSERFVCMCPVGFYGDRCVGESFPFTNLPQNCKVFLIRRELIIMESNFLLNKMADRVKSQSTFKGFMYCL